MLEIVVSGGARMATEGEFTKRAFLNGKCDLTKAESVIELIHADSEKSHAVALGHVKGTLLNKIVEIRKEMMLVLEQVEASLDFPDEVDPIDKSVTIGVVEKIQEQVNEMIGLQDYGQLIQSGVSCLIIGRPNVGKSSLLNQILGQMKFLIMFLYLVLIHLLENF